MFLTIIIGAINDRAPKDFASISVGLGLTLIHLISSPVMNISVNPGVVWSSPVCEGCGADHNGL